MALWHVLESNNKSCSSACGANSAAPCAAAVPFSPPPSAFERRMLTPETSQAMMCKTRRRAGSLSGGGLGWKVGSPLAGLGAFLAILAAATASHRGWGLIAGPGLADRLSLPWPCDLPWLLAGGPTTRQACRLPSPPHLIWTSSLQRACSGHRRHLEWQDKAILSNENCLCKLIAPCTSP